MVISRNFFSLFSWVFLAHFFVINILWLLKTIPTLSVNHPYGNVQYAYLPAPWASNAFLPYLFLSVAVILISTAGSLVIRESHKRFVLYFLVLCLIALALFFLNESGYSYSDEFGVLAALNMFCSFSFVYLVYKPSFGKSFGIIIAVISVLGWMSFSPAVFVSLFLIPYYFLALFTAEYLNRKLAH